MTFFDRLFGKKEIENKATGGKIRALRNRKGISAKELGESCDVNESAIRNYERGFRQVSDDKLSLIATCLDVPVEALRDRNIESYVDVMHILFELSDDYGLYPIALSQEPRYALQSTDDTLIEAIESWYVKAREYEQKKISSDELQEWKDSFPLKSENVDDEIAEIESSEHRFTERERIMGLIRILEQTLLILNDHTEMIKGNLDSKNIRGAAEQLGVTQRTLNTLIKSDIEKYK